MARLRRKGRILKWAGLVLSLVIVLAGAASLRWACVCGVDRESQSDRFGAAIENGCLQLFYIPYQPPHWTRGSIFLCDHDSPHLLAPKLRWKPVYTESFYGTMALVIPLWIPFLLVAIPTAILWRLDRRRIPPGHCLKCGYNLTGNVSGTCPECGERI